MGGGGSSAATWGSITGTITAQTDLVDAVQNSEWVYGATTGTNTYLVNLSPALTAYQTGQVFWILFGNANTGAATLNVNSLGAIALRKNVSTALVSGDIPAGAILPVMYDGTNFQIDLKYAGNPTFQQVLIAGATMTQNNTVAGAGFNFTWDNFLRFIVNTTQRIALVCDNGLGDTSNFQVAPASVGTTVGDGVNNSTVSQNSTQFLIELAALNEHQAADLPSAATTDLAQLIGNSVTITGTTTITSFGSVDSGARRMVTFAGILTLTHNATSLILPTGANIVTAAGDTCIAISLGSGNWKVFNYQRASGIPVAATTVGGNLITLPNPSAITYAQINADNSITALSALQLREAIGIRWAQVTGSNYTTTSATESVVTGLSLSVEANAKYRGTAVIMCGCSGTGGLRIGFNFPTGATCNAGITANTSGSTAQQHQTTGFVSGTAFGANFNTQASASGYISIDFYVETGANAGNVEIIARSGTAPQTSTVYAALSTMKLERIDA